MLVLNLVFLSLPRNLNPELTSATPKSFLHTWDLQRSSSYRKHVA